MTVDRRPVEYQVRVVSWVCPHLGLVLLGRRVSAAGHAVYVVQIHSNLLKCTVGADWDQEDGFKPTYTCSRVNYTRDAVAARPNEFTVARCKTSRFERCFLPVFDPGALNSIKGALNRCFIFSVMHAFKLLMSILIINRKHLTALTFR